MILFSDIFSNFYFTYQKSLSEPELNILDLYVEKTQNFSLIISNILFYFSLHLKRWFYSHFFLPIISMVSHSDTIYPITPHLRNIHIINTQNINDEQKILLQQREPFCLFKYRKKYFSPYNNACIWLHFSVIKWSFFKKKF